ncbi:hypothetical protein HA466_0322930 [Hirschfeldia incana]|nr:hypothetical protein HA466_0322930 [Hirschfeldia incana]
MWTDRCELQGTQCSVRKIQGTSLGLEILAFPCNQFLGQEPGNNEEIQQTVCTRFKAEFPIFDKVDVNGKNTAPLYKYLKAEKGGLLIDAIKWNFTKFLVSPDGKVSQRYSPRTSPLQFETFKLCWDRLLLESSSEISRTGLSIY